MGNDISKTKLANCNQDNLLNMQKQQKKKQLELNYPYKMLGISLVIARNNKGQFLAVNENQDKGWWLPGGLVDPPEDFLTAAIRETKEEAGIDIQIKGILRIEQSMSSSNVTRMKVVFYAEPIDENQVPKQEPDSESQEARWVSLEALQELGKYPPFLRGNELLDFGTYLTSGGVVYPLSVIDQLHVSN